jgi:hypothetical protein
MHRGWYPLVDNQAFRRPPVTESVRDCPPPDTHPVEKAEHLSRTFPLKNLSDGVVSDHASGPPDGTWRSVVGAGKGAIHGRSRSR